MIVFLLQCNFLIFLKVPFIYFVQPLISFHVVGNNNFIILIFQLPIKPGTINKQSFKPIYFGNKDCKITSLSELSKIFLSLNTHLSYLSVRNYNSFSYTVDMEWKNKNISDWK